MISIATDDFWKFFSHLPKKIRISAYACYQKWKLDPFHSSLYFKCVDLDTNTYSVRVGLNYRALGIRRANIIYWCWIGTHREYEKMIRRR